MITAFLLWVITAGTFAWLALKGKQKYPDVEPMPSDTTILVCSAIWPVTIIVALMVRLTDKLTGYDRF